ncbi:PilN domain-containing protein [Vibrio rhizosphaerae]|uniref:PilN domain-containing protein n=1 Tax=Vibrio rhizosphaerae TaxID=398736 RepID=A0ABU4IRU0_9VIBR|nr:PilN domain-containing protein [Vibrio rhizosphaerae]MDW6091658.1 PilN domain-containing protein [Vibrio rhizosphaerae]
MLHELNLMDWRQSQLYRRQRFLYGLWLFGGGLWLAMQSLIYFEWHQQQTRWQQSELQVNSQLSEQQKRLREWEVRRQHAQQNQSKLALAEQWIAHSQLPRRLMSLFVSVIPDGIYLEDIRLTEQQVVLRGFSRHPTAMNRLIHQLRQAPLIRQLDILSMTDEAPQWGSQFNTFQLRLWMVVNSGTDSTLAIEPDVTLEPDVVIDAMSKQELANVH